MGLPVAEFDTLRVIAHGSITNTLAKFGAEITHTVRAFKIVNLTDGNMFISLDGKNNQIYVPAGSFTLYDISSNRQVVQNFTLQSLSQFYIAYDTAPTMNSVYLEILYAKGE